MAKERKCKVSFKEWIWYVIAGLLVAWGLAEVICGIVLDYASDGVTKWPLYEANVKYTELFGLSFLHWGLILMAIGVVTGVIVLCIFAATYDRESEKQNRRAARLRGRKQIVAEAKVEEPKVEETKTETVPEAKVEEEKTEVKSETPAQEDKAN